MKLMTKVFALSERFSQEIVYENAAKIFVSIHFAKKTILIFQYEINSFPLRRICSKPLIRNNEWRIQWELPLESFDDDFC